MTELPPLVTPGPNPFADTSDLRSGPDLHPALLGLLPYVGVWRGVGKGSYPTIDEFDYAQEITFSHDGRPFLHYEARSWLINAEGQPIRPAWRENGWWRPNTAQEGSNELEVLLNNPAGVSEIYVGSIKGLSVELVTDVVARTQTAKEVTAGHRLYGIVEDTLLYAYDMAAQGYPLTSHLSARLARVRNDAQASS